MADLQKIIKVTQAQYNILKAGGTVDEYTGIDPNYLYLVKDTNIWATEDYVDDAMDALASVAWSGSYNDLDDTPTIPTVNDGIFTIQANGTNASFFTANQSGNKTLNIKGSGGTTVTKSATNEITISSTDDNYYPTSMSWVGGTTSGPTATISMSGTSNISVSAIPSASESQSGIVTTGTQTFKGNKSFTGDKTELKATETYLGTTVPSVRALSDEPKTLQLLTMSMTTGGMYDAVIFSGAGDYFLGAHLKSDWDIRASYKGSGDNSDTYDANLGYTGSYLNYLTDWKYGNGWSVLPTKVTTNTPAVIQIKRNTRIDYTDVCRLILTGHNLKDTAGNYSGFLDDYTIEVCTDYTNDTWTTVVNRTNASDNIGKGLFYALQTASYTPIFGIRLTITKCHVNGSGYAFIKITSMQLRDYRPSHDLQTSLGCVSILGGDIYGELKTNNNLRTHYIYPETTNAYNIGSSSSQYNNLYAKTIYENGTSLVDKYLGKTAKAADSDKLNGQSASYYATASSVPTTYLKSASSSGNTLTLTKQDNTTVTFTPSFTDNDHYPTSFSWTNGTTSGPTGSLSGNSGFTSVSFGAIPSANATQSGIVTTNTQTFGGLKTFNDGVKVGTSFGDNDNWADISTTGISLSRGAFYEDNHPHVLTIRSSETWGDIEEEHWGFKFQNGISGPFSVAIPNKTGLISLISDFETETSKNQSTSVVVGNATTNINGRVFQNYTATLVTSGSYVYYQILCNGSNPTEAQAKEYMKYMTGSTFLPTYNYDFPKQTVFTFADRSTWKPQYSSSDGLRLYRLTTPLALESQIPTVNNGTLTIQKNGTQVATFTANQSGNATANITVPVNLADLSGRTIDKISEPTYAGNTPTLTFRPYIYDTAGNRMYGLSPNRIIVEESIDAGQTWSVVTLTDYQKNQLFDNTNNASLQFLKLNNNNTCNAMIRITCALANFGSAADEASDANKLALWTSENYVANTFYCNCDRFYVYVGGPNFCDCTIQTAPAPAPGSAPTFTNQLSIDRARGWNGGNTASSVTPFVLGGNKTQAPIVRFVFRVNSSDGNYDDSKLAQNGALKILNVRLLGPTIWGTSGPMMESNKPYRNASGYPNLFEWYGHLRPNLDNTYNLGSSDRKWKDFHLSGSITFDSDGGYIKVGSSNEIAITSTGTKFDNTVYPWSNNSYDLGTSSLKWKDAYLGGKLYTPEIDYTGGNLIIGNASYYTIIRGDSLLPSANNNRNLGSSSYNWHNLYVNEIFTSLLTPGEGDLILNSTGISFRPSLTNSDDLGTSSYMWKNLFLSGNLTDGTNTLTIAQIKAKQDALPTTTTAGKVLKSTSTAGVVEWGDVVGPGGGVTDVKIGTTSIVSGGIATIPSADATHSGIVTTNNQTFAGDKTFNGEVITYKHILVYGDNDGSDANKPSDVTGFTDLDTYYYNTGVTLFDGDTEDAYKISFPAKGGTFALTSDVRANAQANAEIIYQSTNCGTQAETTGLKILAYSGSAKNISNYRGLVFEILDASNDAVYIYMPVSMWRHSSSSKKVWLNASSASYDRWIVAYYYADNYVQVSDSKSNVGFRIYGIK